MPAQLFVISFIRCVQMGLAIYLFIKCYNLQVSHSIEIFCQSNAAGSLNYDVKFPFDYIHVASQSDCSTEPRQIEESHWTGFGPTAYLFTGVVAVVNIYGLVAIAFYSLKYKAYDVQKRFPAIDLMASLVVGLLWALTCYLGWSNFPEMKKETNPDSVQLKSTICKDLNAYCTSSKTGTWDDLNTYLFLGLANTLSWGISVWFIFMETGLCPDEDEWSDYSDLGPYEGEITGGAAGARAAPTFVAFPQLLEKPGDKYGANFASEYTTGQEQAANTAQLDSQQLLGYLNWKNTQQPDLLTEDGIGFGRFSQGMTFTPIVPTISEEIDTKGVKVHKKFNLFQA